MKLLEHQARQKECNFRKDGQLCRGKDHSNKLK